MNLGKWLVVICCAGLFIACDDGDDRDDSILNMSDLTGKDWYYNAWLGEKYSYGEADLLEVVRFEKGGVLKLMDFSGRTEVKTGEWKSEGNKINLYYEGKEPVVWNVQHSGEDYIETIVNAQGKRKYTTDLGYLENLTADAFLVNEFTMGNYFHTHIGVDVRGNINVREGALIPAAGQSVPLENHGYYWSERSPKEEDIIDFDGKIREVRFYLRIGKGTNLKLRDFIYSENLPERVPGEMGLKAMGEASELTVQWYPFTSPRVYYQVEIFPRNMDLSKPYFVSRIQPAGSTGMKVKNTTAGEVNRLPELVPGETYGLRLSALLYEPGVDVINDEYSYANLQAVTYYTDVFIWK